MTDGFLIFLMMFLPLLSGIFVISAQKNASENAFDVAIASVLINIITILYAFSKISLPYAGNEISTNLSWNFTNNISLLFSADIVSLLFVFAVQISVFIALLGVKNESDFSKGGLFETLGYVTCLNGYFFARDLLSFYICFALMIIWLYMLIEKSLPEKQQDACNNLILHYFLSMVLFFGALILISGLKKNNVLIAHLSDLKFSHKASMLIWGGLFMAFILRVPVWPFHHILITLSSHLKNSLSFILLHFIPLSGIYAFMRFWPLDVPLEIELLSPLFRWLCVLTMILTAVGGYISSKQTNKLHQYIYTYDLFYLFSVFLPTDVIQQNIVYSIFSFTLISSGLVVLQNHILHESSVLQINTFGILRYMRRVSIAYGLFISAAVGLPISAFFWNNFVIISEIFNYGLYMGTLVVIAISIASLSMLQSLYILYDDKCDVCSDTKPKDIDFVTFCVLIMAVITLLFSFVKPLWFVF